MQNTVLKPVVNMNDLQYVTANSLSISNWKKSSYWTLTATSVFFSLDSIKHNEA